MRASYEPIVGIIRAGKGHTGFGTPFSFSVAVVSLEPELAFLKAAVGEIGRQEMLSICKLLLQIGFKRAKWERMRKDGSVKTVSVDLKQLMEKRESWEPNEKNK